MNEVEKEYMEKEKEEREREGKRESERGRERAFSHIHTRGTHCRSAFKLV